MKLVDLNVLLYIVNEDAVHHRASLDWWQETLQGDEPLGLAWVVLLGFLRLTTNPTIFPPPRARAPPINRSELRQPEPGRKNRPGRVCSLTSPTLSSATRRRPQLLLDTPHGVYQIGDV